MDITVIQIRKISKTLESALERQIYRFSVLPKRLSTWPFWFGKLLKPNSANLKKEKTLLLGLYWRYLLKALRWI